MSADSHPRASVASAATVVRTRFAPSPTGFLHIGGARTALYAWAFAKHFGGTFVLRVEDTDLERSTPQAVQAILDGMAWLGLKEDEGPYFQMQRMKRYREVIAQMLDDGRAYHCWTSPAELEQMREAQRARGEKPRYDGRWRPERAKAAGLLPPRGVDPVVRFRNPDDGEVAWDDLVSGPISIANGELDDLVIARADGTPTYNFCVVVDDLDMRITHVIRGNDHVNNTPRQINILRALGGAVPVYGHLPMIHGSDGQKLSKRHGAVSVTQYADEGYLPEAVLNYLARLGWSHGDDEVFSVDELVRWFDGTHLSQSASQLDFDKLRWVNQQHMKASDDARLAHLVRARLVQASTAAAASAAAAIPSGSLGMPDPSCSASSQALPARVDEGLPTWVDEGLPTWVGLLKDRCATLVELAAQCRMLAVAPDATAASLAADAAPVVAALKSLRDGLAALPDWDKASIAAELKRQLTAAGLKMPQLAMPLRRAVFGREQTPSVDAVLAALPRQEVLARLARALA